MTPHSLEKRTAPLSRREFIQSLIPSWATKKNLQAGAIGAGLLLALAVVFSFLRDIGFLNTLKFIGLGLGLYGALLLSGLFIVLAQQAFKKSPPFVQSLVVVFLRFAWGIALCALGAFAYNCWETSKDRTGIIIGLSTVFILTFLDEWQKRTTARQRAETRTAD